MMLLEGSYSISINVEVELCSIFSQKQRFCKLDKSFCHANNMASSGLWEMLYLTISNTLGVLLLVCPVCFTDMCGLCNGRCYSPGMYWQMLCQ